MWIQNISHPPFLSILDLGTQCGAPTKQGAPCKRRVATGTRCGLHQAPQSQPSTPQIPQMTPMQPMDLPNVNTRQIRETKIAFHPLIIPDIHEMTPPKTPHPSL